MVYCTFHGMFSDSQDFMESTFALPSPGLSLHFEESFPTERAVRLACPGRGVSEVSDG